MHCTSFQVHIRKRILILNFNIYKNQDFDLIRSSGWRAGEVDVVRVAKKLVMMMKKKKTIHIIDIDYVDLVG